MANLETHRWAEATERICREAREALRASREGEVQDLVRRLPHTDVEGSPISLAFAGQYSAGKSTIISALTGRDDIAIGAGITTDRTGESDWNGVTIIDTPGIHTSLRPDHDEITYRAISRSDLLVFVITNELFDDHMADHFRKLAVDLEKGYETILVVNKMGRAAAGNAREAREVITDDLRRPLAPFTPEELRITFTDAASALEGRTETDAELADILNEQANIGELVANLNDLIRQKGMPARHTTRLYAVDRALQEAMALEKTDDPDADAISMIYGQNIRAIQEARSALTMAADNTISAAVTQVMLDAGEFAERHYPGVGREEIDSAGERMDAGIQSVWEQLSARLNREAEAILPAMDQRLAQIHESRRFQAAENSIRARSSTQSDSSLLSVTANSARRLGDLGRQVAVNPAAAGATGLARFSGSAAHGAVLNVGHMMGHSFRPWEAVKLARGIGAAGTALSVGGIALGIGLQIWQDRQEARQDREFQQARWAIRTDYARVAGEMEAEARGVVDDFIATNLTQPLERLQGYADELNAARQEQNRRLERLAEISNRAKQLIHAIHAA
ncbi:MAG: 50S ribosome-binding GTPase [Chloroflexi bacterium]|nr:50S ribosome-binding GTPase [Chloroflexota bacterium]